MRLSLALRWVPLAVSCMLLEILTRESRQVMLSSYVTSKSKTTDDAHLKSKLLRTKKAPFTGTIVTRHTGVDIYENVCIATVETDEEDEDGDTIRRNTIFSYTSEGTPLGTEPVLDSAEWADWVTTTEGRPLQDWELDSEERLVEEDTLLMLSLWNNPAHCLSDQVFSIAVDILSRGLQRTGTDNTFYPKYLRAHWTELSGECPPEDWCCQFMNMVGIISKDPIQPPPPDLTPICFRRLIVPRHAAYRYPPVDPFMTEALETVQRMALNATSLRSESWKKKKTAKKAPILLYDRRGSGRRIFKNSFKVQQLIEAKYHAKVTLMGADWEDLIDQHNVTSQAIVYNSFPYIIAPHGAHFTNLFFTRKDTRVMEITCWIPEKPSPRGELFLNLTSKEEASDEDDWYGEPSPFEESPWFYSFSRRLGVEHFVYAEHDGCMNKLGELPGHPNWASPNKITVDEARFVSFVGNRFKLKPRHHH